MLFDINEKSKEGKDIRTSFFTNNHKAIYISSQDEYLHKKLKNTDLSNNNDAIHFKSDGRFGLHDLIIFYAHRIEKANCIVSSFNISSEAARKFIRVSDLGFFYSLKFILNIQKRHNFKKALNILNRRFPIHFMRIHAKVAVIWNGKYNITIITSGNLSSNQNEERGIIFFDKKTFDFDYKKMNDVFKTT